MVVLVDALSLAYRTAQWTTRKLSRFVLRFARIIVAMGTAMLTAIVVARLTTPRLSIKAMVDMEDIIRQMTLDSDMEDGWVMNNKADI